MCALLPQTVKNVNKELKLRPLFKAETADSEHLRDCRKGSVHAKHLLTDFNWTIHTDHRGADR